MVRSDVAVVEGSVVADTALGRDHRSDVILLITAPPGTKVTDPQISTKVEKFVDDLLTKYPTVVQRAYNGDTSTPEGEQSALRNNQQVIDPFFTPTDAAGKAAQDIVRSRTITPDQQRAFISIGVAGNDDTTVLNNFKTIEPFFDNIAQRYDLPAGTTFQLAGLQPVAGAMARGMDADIHRAEIIALPLVALMLFFIFGGVIAACLPVFIGGLTIAGSLGIMNAIAQVTELNIFAQSVVTLIGLGIAIDYGLFIVSRFREELAEGYSTKAAVRRTVMTAGQTVVFSATIIVAAIACLLIMPQGFLKSVPTARSRRCRWRRSSRSPCCPHSWASSGRASTHSRCAGCSPTPCSRSCGSSPRRADRLDHRVADLTGRTKSREEIENGFWGRLSGWVMKHPVATAVPTVLLLLVLTIPFGGIKFGGISEQYLPPDNPSRVAQEAFDKYFPTERTEDIKLVIMYDENNSSAGNAISQIADEANKVPGFTKKFSSSADDGALTGSYGSSGLQVLQMSAGLVNRDTAGEAIKDLRKIDVPSGMRMWVAGTPALTQDSIDALLQRLPLMALMLVLITGLLMFLAFGRWCCRSRRR